MTLNSMPGTHQKPVEIGKTQNHKYEQTGLYQQGKN